MASTDVNGAAIAIISVDECHLVLSAIAASAAVGSGWERHEATMRLKRKCEETIDYETKRLQEPGIR